MIFSIIIFILFYIRLPLGFSCSFFAKKNASIYDSQLPGKWNHAQIPLINGANCECGTLNNDSIGQSNSILYIQINSTDDKDQSAPDPNDQNCIGTIVSSNLVATSHLCIQNANSFLNVYDAWNVSKATKSSYSPEEIIVSTQPFGEVEIFKVEKVIPLPRFLQRWRARKKEGTERKEEYYKNDNSFNVDMLLLKVKADFTTHQTHRPIGLPNEGTNLLKRTGLYIAGMSPHPSTDVDVHQGIIKTMANYKDGYSNEEEGDSNDFIAHPYYIRWRNWEGGKLLLGGSLVVPIKVENNKRLLLAGLLHGSASSWGSTTAFFTNIIPLLKYIKYQAHQPGSKLCKEKPFQLGSTEENTPGKDPKIDICEKQGEGGQIQRYDIVLARIFLKTKEFNQISLSVGKYKKVYTSDPVTNEDNEKFVHHANFDVPDELKPANSYFIKTIHSINKISRETSISVEKEENFDEKFRYHFNILRSMRDAYHHQVDNGPRESYQFSATNFGGLSTNVLPCTTMSQFFDCKIVENVKLNYEAFVEISGRLDNGMSVGADGNYIIV